VIGLLISLFLGTRGKWRWLGYAYLAELVIIGTAGLLRGAGNVGILLIVFVPLAEIALGYGLGALWSLWRRGSWPKDRAIARMIPIRRGFDEAGEETLYWEVEAPVLTPRLAQLYGLVIVLAFVAGAAIFGLVLGGDFIAGAVMAGIGCAGATMLFAFGVFGLLLNRLRRIYLFTGSFYATVISDPRLFARVPPTGAGSTLSAQQIRFGAAVGAAASHGEHHDWASIAAAGYDPRHSRIRLQFRKGGWLCRDCIHCHPDDYPAASAWVARHIGQA
jgi:hypothetical protein